MSKLPTKQIYLLLVIIVGILTLSVYSTYSIFTLESETSNIVNIHTPNTLEIGTELYEYKQLAVPKNSYITTDVDLYNSHDYELCYSVWYKLATSSAEEDKIKIHQNIESNLTTSGLIESMNSKRISLIITNDNDSDVKINIGLSSSKNEGTCELNISKDKSTVTSIINEPKELTDMIIKNTGKKITNESGYLIYKNEKETISYDEDKIYIATSFKYKDEVFTLTDPKEIVLNNSEDNPNDKVDIMNYQSNETTSYYTCVTGTECKFLYKINKIEKETIKDETTNEYIDYYKMTNYDRYVGYLKGESGIKKVTQNNVNNYIYYGDNPNNFIYYNCTNELDTKTCELWRIIGVFYDNKENKYITKIIRNDSIGTYKFGTITNSWNDSLINKYFSNEYKINNDGFIKEINLTQENITDLNIELDKVVTQNTKETSFVSLMSVSDYLNASICENKKINEYNATCLNNNWLNKNIDTFEWTNSIKYLEVTSEEVTEETTGEILEETTDEQLEEIIEDIVTVPQNNTVYSVGSKLQESPVTESFNVRPVVYLKSRILLASGEGTLEKPYIIK